MKAVIVDGDLSYPPTSGKRLRSLHLMLGLARRHRITYVARNHDGPEANRVARRFFADRGIEAIILDDPIPRKKGVSFHGRLAANLFSRLPYSVSSHYSESFRAAVARHVSPNNVDLYQIEFSGYLYAVPPGNVPVVLQAQNVESLLWQRYYEAERNPIKRWFVYQQWRKYLTFEREAFRSASHVVAVSLEDAALVRELYDVQHVEVVDNGVDVAHFADLRPSLDSRTILYLGSLDWRPNLDALDLLLDEIFPAVRALVPEARLVIVGRSPPEALRRQVSRRENVELHPDVPDVRPYLASAAVLAVPLRIGGGSRLKILEALAAGLPVVASRIGAEGLILRPDQDYTLADNAEEFTRALIHCLNQPEQARRQAERGRQTVAGRYDWSSLADRLERVWEKARAGG